MEIENLEIAKLTPFAENPKLHTHGQIEHLMNSISWYGFTQPIVVDENNMILAGHGRYEAAKHLNLEEVPVRRVRGLSYEAKKVLCVFDNKSTLDTDLDQNKLNDIFEELAENDFPLNELGFYFKTKSLDDLDNDKVECENPDSGLDTGIKQMIIHLPGEKFETATNMMERIMEANDYSSHTEVFLYLLECHEGN